MFNSTHTLVGFAFGRSGAEKWARYATATAVIASNLPDVDSIAGFWGTAAYLDHHRGLTHSPVGILVLALLLSAVMYFFSGNFWKTYAVALIAMATHPMLDFLNSYGVRPLLPLKETWYYGDVAFIFDPYMDLALLSGIFLGSLMPKRRRAMAFLSLLLVVFYIGAKAQLHATATAKLRETGVPIRNAKSVAVMPTMWNPLRWDVIATSDTGVARFDICAIPCGEMRAEIIPMNSAPASEIVTRASSAKSAVALLRFARFPVTRVERLNSGYRVTFIDFRFYSEATNTALGSEVILDDSMNVTKENLSFAHAVFSPRL
jgi:inner membrane protein